MKWIIGILAIAVIGYLGYNAMNTAPATQSNDTTSMNNPSIPEIVPLNHATFLMKWDNTVILNDPVNPAHVQGQPAANIILVTDIHGDHFSSSTLSTIKGSATLIVPQAVADMLPTDLQSSAKVLTNGQSITEQGFTITAVPAYNLPEAENKDRHVKGRGNGYIVEKDGYRVYIAGDTAGVPEMRALTDIDVAFVPMNLPFTMDPAEAADAVLDFKPKIVYPYHYRTPNGLADVAQFRDLVRAGDPNIEVILGNWYPETNS